MKTLFLLLASAALLVTGCATPQQVAQSEGAGAKKIYAAPFDQVWRAAVDAAQIGSLQVRSADPTSGYIATNRGVRPHTFGENVGIWVKQYSPTQTQVEVLSRQAGPPKLWFKNWEDEIFNAISANLTREASLPRVISEPAGVELRRYEVAPLEQPDIEPYPIPPPPPLPEVLP